MKALDRLLRRFPRGVWVCDTEFAAPQGEVVDPVCLVAHECGTRRKHRLWRDELQALKGKRPPFPTGPGALFVAFVAAAENGVFHVLEWNLPNAVLDLSIEYKRDICGLDLDKGDRNEETGGTYEGWSLPAALSYYGLNSLDAASKKWMQKRIAQGPPFTAREKLEILDYCEQDVRATSKLLEVMIRNVDLEAALFRGHYTTVVPKMEHRGVPLDAETFHLIIENLEAIKVHVVAKVPRAKEVFDGFHFNFAKFSSYLDSIGLLDAWPRTPKGRLATDRDTLRDMKKIYPGIAWIPELRHFFEQLDLRELAVGRDGRNRTRLWEFSSVTGRNQPSNARFIFGPSTWIRFLIQPPPGIALAYLDFAAQEVAIAGALSGDESLKAAYQSGDPYMYFLRLARLVPPDATKRTHPHLRAAGKQTLLGSNYGMTYHGLANKLGISKTMARVLLTAHRRTFPTFHEWQRNVIDNAKLRKRIWTSTGWSMRVTGTTKVTTLRNWPMQSFGSEMIRLACILADEVGLEVLCPVHDALLIQAPQNQIREAVTECKNAMARAGRELLDEFPIRVDVEDDKIVHHPGRFFDERGVGMWLAIVDVLHELDLITENGWHELRSATKANS